MLLSLVTSCHFLHTFDARMRKGTAPSLATQNSKIRFTAFSGSSSHLASNFGSGSGSGSGSCAGSSVLTVSGGGTGVLTSSFSSSLISCLTSGVVELTWEGITPCTGGLVMGTSWLGLLGLLIFLRFDAMFELGEIMVSSCMCCW